MILVPQASMCHSHNRSFLRHGPLLLLRAESAFCNFSLLSSHSSQAIACLSSQWHAC